MADSKKKRLRNDNRKNKITRYLTRSTCVVCRVVFRSPRKRQRHADSGHKSMIGANPRRAYKTSSGTGG